MIKRHSQIIAFAVVLFLIYLYDKSEMFTSDVYENVGFLSHTMVVFVLSLFSLLYSWLSRYRLERTKLRLSFTCQMMYMYLFSILMTVTHPFTSRYLYFAIILPLIMFYVSYKITFAVNDMRIILIGYMTLMLALSGFYFFNYQNNILYEVNRANNASYTILFFLPFVLCLKNKIVKTALSLLIFISILYSLKRGGLFAITFGIMVYLLISSFEKSRQIRKLLTIIGAFGIIFVLYGLFLNFDKSKDGLFTFRLNEMVDSGGAGRIGIYKDKLILIYKSTPLELVFGHGWRATEVNGTISKTAHNDFIEVLYDFGLIGFCLFIWVLNSLIKLCKELINEKSRLAAPLGTSLAIMFVNLLVAHIWIYSHYLTTFALFWGFVLAAKDFDYFKNNEYENWNSNIS